MKSKLRPSITDLVDPRQLAIKVHSLIENDTEQDENLEMIWDILSTMLNVAVCDYCQREWFTVEPIPYGPRGDVRGLLVDGTACCTKCLDRLYEETADMEQEDADAIFHDVAHWLNRHRGNMNLTVFGKDRYILDLMKRFSI